MSSSFDTYNRWDKEIVVLGYQRRIVESCYEEVQKALQTLILLENDTAMQYLAAAVRAFNNELATLEDLEAACCAQARQLKGRPA